MPFSFVDQITGIEPGRRARGQFTVPPAWTRFPACLVAEAVGQLAAWAAMAHVRFDARPVAALAQAVTIGGTPAPGAVIDLVVELQRCDRDVVLYGGTAHVKGAVIVELERCIGPMLPMADFDDPASVRQRFEQLCHGRVPSRDWSGSDWSLPAVHCDHKLGEYLAAALQVPRTASFFDDHFPRRPVLPATLLLDAEVRLAMELARDAAVRAGTITLVRVRDVKMRAFVAPGQLLTIGAQVMAARATSAEIAVYAKMGGKQVATARVELAIG